MSTGTIDVPVPKELKNVFNVSEGDLGKEALKSIAVELYREGKISMGKAAEIAGLSKIEMMGVLREKKVPLQYSEEDLEEDMKALR
ncbi:MAG: UPF0175 family protein [Thermoplasmata archaeon]